jgi:steroid 5-alpha reductase family enzyme
MTCLRTRILLVPAILASTAAFADPQTAGQLRKEFDNCVYAAVGKQWQANPRIDSSLAAEMGFQACATEEQAMGTLLYSMSMPASQVNTAIVGVKLQVKRIVREIMADPAGYKKKHGG